MAEAHGKQVRLMAHKSLCFASIFMYMCLCYMSIYVCLDVWRHICMQVHVCACIWKPEDEAVSSLDRFLPYSLG